MKYILHPKKHKKAEYPITASQLTKAVKMLDSLDVPMENRWFRFNTEDGVLEITTDEKGEVKTIRLFKDET